MSSKVDMKWLDWNSMSDLTVSERLILLFIQSSSNDDGYCDLSYTHIMSKTGVAKSTLTTALNVLESEGYITRTHREKYIPKRVNDFNRYTLVLQTGGRHE